MLAALLEVRPAGLRIGQLTHATERTRSQCYTGIRHLRAIAADQGLAPVTWDRIDGYRVADLPEVWIRYERAFFAIEHRRVENFLAGTLAAHRQKEPRLLVDLVVTPADVTDSAYAGDLVDWAAAELRIALRIVRRPVEQKGFVLLPRGWVVERPIAWLMRARRNCRDCERLIIHTEAHLVWSAVHLMSRRLDRLSAASHELQPVQNAA
ncbi:hypothetical protein ACWFRJ_00775 [Streptomyces sp. NPDC055239]